jgi:hypothetical protein
MRRAAARTLAVHRGSGLVVWHGRQRLGKTVTAKWLSKKINEQHSPDNPDSFRSVYYEVAGASATLSVKHGIRSLYHATIGRLDEGTYRHLPAEDLALQLVHGLRRKNIQVAFVDEAGSLPLAAIRGMVVVRDVAENTGWTLTLVFVGMDDLPTKLIHLPQIDGRVHEWCYFEPYSVDEVWQLLSELHPHFAGLDARKKAHREQVEFIYKTFGGVPGQIVPFIRKMSQRLQEYGGEPDLILLRSVHLSTVRDKTRALKDARLKYQDKPPEVAGEPQKVSKKRAQKEGDAA